MSDTGKYCWGRVSLILGSCRGYGHEAPQLLGLVSPQTELQEVLGADEEAGPLDGDETASPGGSEKEQENIEPPVQTALLTASVPEAQVGSGGSTVPLSMSFVPACPCITHTEHGLPRNTVVTLSRALLQQLPQAEAEPKELLGGCRPQRPLCSPRPPPAAISWPPQLVWASVFASDMASGLSNESLPPTLRLLGSSFSLNPRASFSGAASLQGGSSKGLAGPGVVGH